MKPFVLALVLLIGCGSPLPDFPDASSDDAQRVDVAVLDAPSLIELDAGLELDDAPRSDASMRDAGVDAYVRPDVFTLEVNKDAAGADAGAVVPRIDAGCGDPFEALEGAEVASGVGWNATYSRAWVGDEVDTLRARVRSGVPSSFQLRAQDTSRGVVTIRVRCLTGIASARCSGSIAHGIGARLVSPDTCEASGVEVAWVGVACSDPSGEVILDVTTTQGPVTTCEHATRVELTTF